MPEFKRVSDADDAVLTVKVPEFTRDSDPVTVAGEKTARLI